MTIEEGHALIQSGVVKEGMIPKLEECFAAVRAGASQVHIVGRLTKGELSREITAPGSIGTVVVA
jgi:acetylglutamate kinase